MAEHEERRNRPGRGEEEMEQRREGGRTLGDTATSYNPTGGYGVGDEETGDARGGGRREFRPGMEDIVEEVDPGEGADLPFTGEGPSTRGSTFHENPATGETADEEDGEFLRESLERRTRRYESG